MTEGAHISCLTFGEGFTQYEAPPSGAAKRNFLAFSRYFSLVETVAYNFGRPSRFLFYRARPPKRMGQPNRFSSPTKRMGRTTHHQTRDNRKTTGNKPQPTPAANPPRAFRGDAAKGMRSGMKRGKGVRSVSDCVAGPRLCSAKRRENAQTWSRYFTHKNDIIPSNFKATVGRRCCTV